MKKACGLWAGEARNGTQRSVKRYTGAMGTVVGERITRTPDVCGGKACIAGHRVRVLDIVVMHEHQGLAADAIVSRLPSITLADVHAALTYYFDHIDEIQEELRTARARAEEFRGRNASVLHAKIIGPPLEEAS